MGCMVGPNYRRPDVDIPPGWRIEEKETSDIGNTAWWDQFRDPVLKELIETALRENRDLKIAAARVEEFVARSGSARGALYPQVTLGASAGGSRMTEKGMISPGAIAENPAGNFLTFLSASWELDVWGKLRRTAEAARADLLGTEEGRRAVILTLVSSVASSYVHLRDLDSRLEIVKRTARTREETYKLFQSRFEKGRIAELPLNQVKSEYEQALLTIPAIEKAIARQENALSVLLARNPGPIPRGNKIDELELPAVPAGLPSDLLANRPDIRQAEQDLVAANARIGVARALYFPSISLTGLFGFASTDLANLFTAPAKIWNLAAPMFKSVFDGGTIRGQVKSAEAVQKQALLRYQKSVQAGFREVDDALSDQKKTREQLQIQIRQMGSLLKTAQTARQGFDRGKIRYIEVLDAERRLFNGELSLVETKGIVFRDLVNLYKAMGGGWVVEADRIAISKAES